MGALATAGGFCTLGGGALDLVGKQIGNYIAKAELGRGGMGVVYLAEHPHIGRKVAVKVLHEELAINEQMVQRLWLEAKSASEIDSDHIVAMLDFGRMPLGMAGGEQRQTVYLAMELLSGKSLADHFWEYGLSFREAVDLARQICRALEASHAKGIVHRDLKPENVFLIERDGKKNFVKVLDFGIAKLIDNPYTRTRTGVLLGTPAYMSPEQCRGSGAVDHRSDIYSLGVMLYELTSGTVPFAAQGYGDVLVAQMTRKPEPPSSWNPGIPKTLETVILCAMEKRVEDRFQSMAAMGAALANVATELDAIFDAGPVAALSRSERTTEREAANSDLATMMDPPSADQMHVMPLVRGDLHAAPTRALGVDSIHHRSTQIKGDGSINAQTTMLKEPLSAKSPLGQRLDGVSLREALGSTNAVRALEAALDSKGAPRPVVASARVVPSAHGVDESAEADAFLAREARRLRIRIAAVAAVVVAVGTTLLLVLR